MDDSAASPLTVILVVMLATAGLVALLFFTLEPDPPATMEVQPGEGAFNVAKVRGSLDWEDLEMRLVDRAGYDRATLYLDIPEGRVDVGDSLGVDEHAPAGTYVLVVSKDGRELSRATMTV